MYNTPMYVLASKLESLPILSLQTGETVAAIQRPVIDTANLELPAYLCQAAHHDQPLLLMSRDIRQTAPDCIIIDSEEELTETNEVVRLGPLLEQDFIPLGKVVVTDLGRQLGHIEDYTINTETSRIQKLYIRQSILRSLLGSSLIVDRAQIIEVTPRQIIVRDTATKAPMLATKPTSESNT